MSLLPALFRRGDDDENRPLGPAVKAAAPVAPDPVREFEQGDHSAPPPRVMFDPFLDSDLPALVDGWRAEADRLCGVPDPTNKTASELSNEIMNAKRRALFDHMYLTANPPRIVSREGVDLGPLRVDPTKAETASDRLRELLLSHKTMFKELQPTPTPGMVNAGLHIEGDERWRVPLPVAVGADMGSTEGDQTVLPDGWVLWRGESQVDENGDVSGFSLVMSPMLPKP